MNELDKFLLDYIRNSKPKHFYEIYNVLCRRGSQSKLDDEYRELLEKRLNKLSEDGYISHGWYVNE